MELLTTDLSDANPDTTQVLEPMLFHFGAVSAFHGPIRTVKVFEDNTLVRSALEQPGEGHVLVVDDGGSTRCALVGDRLAALARDGGWAGIVVYGCIRDSREIGEIEVGVMAVATHPRKSVKRGHGAQDLPLSFGGVTFEPGAWLYADEDGILVAAERLHPV